MATAPTAIASSRYVLHNLNYCVCALELQLMDFRPLQKSDTQSHTRLHNLILHTWICWRAAVAAETLIQAVIPHWLTPYCPRYARMEWGKQGKDDENYVGYAI